MDVGIYGPLAGYIASVLAVAVGFALSRPRRRQRPGCHRPLWRRTAHHPPASTLCCCTGTRHPPFDHIAPHPVLVAGWIGLFITSLNLIPGGQLDGGHILYAISPRAHRVFTNFLPFLLFLAGAIFWVGWILWGIFLHDPRHAPPQGSPRRPSSAAAACVLGIIGIAIFLLTFTPTPFYDNSLMHFFRVDPYRRAHVADTGTGHLPSWRDFSVPNSRNSAEVFSHAEGRQPHRCLHISRSASTSTTRFRRGTPASSACASIPRSAAFSALRDAAFRIK